MSEQENKEGAEKTEASGVFDAASLAIPAAAEPASGDASRVAELEKQLQMERVENGRVRKLADENRQLREERDRLKSEVETLKTRNPEDYLDPNERESLDEEQARLMGKMAKGMMDDALKPLKAENAELRSRMEADKAARRSADESNYTAEVNRLAPGLLKTVLSEHRDEWNEWAGARRRKASVSEAIKSFDAETTAAFLSEFCREKGISAPEGGKPGRASTPTPATGGAALEIGDKTVYTFEEYDAAMRRATDDYEHGRITADEYRAASKKLAAARDSGRVR